MSRSIPSRQRYKGADSNTNSGTLNRDCGEAQSIARPVTQSGSYIEKLKPQEPDELGYPSMTCYNKNYGDASVKLFKNTEGDQLEFLSHQRNIYNIESLDSLGASKGPNRSLEYQGMDTLSNTETLAIGSTMSDHKFQTESSSENIQKQSSNINKNSKNEQFDYILTEKHVSPPSAFVDRVG